MEVGLSGGLQVVDLRTDVRLARNRDELVNGLEELVAFAPEVRDVAAVVFGRGLAEFDQFVGLGVERRRVDQRRTDAERALFHRLAHVAAHAFEFVVRRRPVIVAHLVDPQRGRTDERRHVAGNPLVLEELQVLAKRRPRDLEVVVGNLLQEAGLHGLGERAHRPALAHHLERHALADVALRAAVVNQGHRSPAQHVDEARRHGQAFGIEGLRGRAELRANRRDAVAGYRDVRFEGLAAEAVIDEPVGDQQVEVWCVAAGARAGDEQRGQAEGPDSFDHYCLPPPMLTDDQ